MAITEVCEVKPIEAFLSTNLTNRDRTFQEVADKVAYSLGYPTVTLPIQTNQIYNAISIALQLYYKYAGVSEEYLIFDSRMYERNRGIRIDKLYTIASLPASLQNNARSELFRKTVDKQIELPKRVYVAIRDISAHELPSSWPREIKNNQIISADDYDQIVSYNSSLCSYFKVSRPSEITINGEEERIQPEVIANAFDYDLMDYRKVAQVIDYQESSNRSASSLFTIESALASQAYYSYQFSLKGFDLLSYHTLHEFIKTRNRTLALNRSFYFDPYTQYFTLSPQPKDGQQFFGVITCKVERPLRDVIGEIWIYKYTLAQLKVLIGTIRGWNGSVNLAGGGTIADNLNLRNSGEQEMKELEAELIDRSAFSTKAPPRFFIG